MSSRTLVHPGGQLGAEVQVQVYELESGRGTDGAIACTAHGACHLTSLLAAQLAVVCRPLSARATCLLVPVLAAIKRSGLVSSANWRYFRIWKPKYDPVDEKK